MSGERSFTISTTATNILPAFLFLPFNPNIGLSFQVVFARFKLSHSFSKMDYDGCAPEGQQTPPPPYSIQDPDVHTAAISAVNSVLSAHTASMSLSDAPVSTTTRAVEARPTMAPTSGPALSSAGSISISARGFEFSPSLVASDRRRGRSSLSGTSLVSTLSSLGRVARSSVAQSRAETVSDFVLEQNYQQQQQQEQPDHQPVGRLPRTRVFQDVSGEGAGALRIRLQRVSEMNESEPIEPEPESDAESDLELASALETMTQSFLTDIAAVNQYPATFGVPCQINAQKTLQPSTSASGGLEDRLRASAVPRPGLRSIMPELGSRTSQESKIAFIVNSAQVASRANCRLRSAAREAMEAVMASLLASARDDDEAEIFHVHTLRCHAAEDDQPNQGQYQQATQTHVSTGHSVDTPQHSLDTRTGESSGSRNRVRKTELQPIGSDEGKHSYRAASSGAKPLSWAMPLEGEYSIFKWGNSVFARTPLERFLRWRNCDTVVLIGFDTPSEFVNRLSMSDYDPASSSRQVDVALKSGGDLQLSREYAVSSGFNAHIVSQAYIHEVSQLRTYGTRRTRLLPSQTSSGR
ncbi:hypothetical protein CF327_g2464 [Tilletia walkeri]|nr:hypothetical protein CF327_g2464 [Tilletia walkeri]